MIGKVSAASELPSSLSIPIERAKELKEKMEEAHNLVMFLKILGPLVETVQEQGSNDTIYFGHGVGSVANCALQHIIEIDDELGNLLHEQLKQPISRD
jgi:hypothetical protein